MRLSPVLEHLLPSLCSSYPSAQPHCTPAPPGRSLQYCSQPPFLYLHSNSTTRTARTLLGVFPSAAGNLSVVLLLSHWVVVSFVYQLRRAGLGVEEDRDTGSDHSPRCTSLRSNTGYCHRVSDLPHKGAEPEGIVSSVGDNYIIRTLTSNNSLLFHDVSQYVSTKVIRNWLHMKQTR